MFASPRRTLLSPAWDSASSGLSHHSSHCLAPTPDCEPHEGRAKSALEHGSVPSAQHRGWHRWA